MSSPSSHPQKRKKWTEAEERALLDKYAEMSADGSLSRLRTREKRFRPIAAHVNSLHHLSDPSSFPFLWSWKDASTKVQNMRHQYSLVQQKLLLPSPPDPLSLWPNFHRYRLVFGDLPPSEPPCRPARPRRSDRAWALVRDQLSMLRDREDRLAQVEAEARRRRREEDRRWEEAAELGRAEWRRRLEGAMAQHRAEMEQMHARALQDQQALLGQLLAVAAQLGCAGMGDGAGVPSCGQNHHHHHHHNPHHHTYISQMVQGFNHAGGLEPGEDRIGGGRGDSQEGDQFIVDDD